MNEIFDSYSLIIETDETTALILGETLADWNLGIHLPELPANHAKGTRTMINLPN